MLKLAAIVGVLYLGFSLVNDILRIFGSMQIITFPIAFYFILKLFFLIVCIVVAKG